MVLVHVISFELNHLPNHEIDSDEEIGEGGSPSKSPSKKRRSKKNKATPQKPPTSFPEHVTGVTAWAYAILCIALLLLSKMQIMTKY